MPTEHDGGQGQIRQIGSFEVHYTATTPKRGRHERTRKFTEYDKAQALYDSVDDSAAIWDVTHYGELCESKSRVAYFVATVQTIRPPRITRTLHVSASDEEGTAAHVSHQVFRRGWKLVPGSVHEVTEAEYSAFNPEDELTAFIGTLTKRLN
jgi:hypothetical protein